MNQKLTEAQWDAKVRVIEQLMRAFYCNTDRPDVRELVKAEIKRLPHRSNDRIARAVAELIGATVK